MQPNRLITVVSDDRDDMEIVVEQINHRWQSDMFTFFLGHCRTAYYLLELFYDGITFFFTFYDSLFEDDYL